MVEKFVNVFLGSVIFIAEGSQVTDEHPLRQLDLSFVGNGFEVLDNTVQKTVFVRLQFKFLGV